MNIKKRKSIKSSASTPRSQPIAAPTAPDASQPHLVRIHDLKSFAVIVLPKELRGLIGDEAYECLLDDLKTKELVLVVREPHDVVYVRMPLRVLSPSTEAQVPSAVVKPPSRTTAKSKSAPAAKPTPKTAVKTIVKPARKSSGKA